MKKVLCIHGIGGKDDSINEWSPKWKESIKNNLGLSEDPDFKFLKYDYLFDESHKRIGRIKYLQAIATFIKSWREATLATGEKSLGGVIDDYAGMPAQFVTDPKLRDDLYALLKKTIDEEKPDLIYAHSLGTAIIYDYSRQETARGNKQNYILITSGTQINHPAMISQFGGKILPLSVNYWLNLHNENDIVFAKFPIGIHSVNFKEVDTPFHYKLINHEVLEYMNHENAKINGWSEIKNRLFAKTLAGAKGISINELIQNLISRKPNRKALLVGINDYPDPDNKLNGCVNDVYRMSEVLQESGFRPEDIRVVVNNRATAKGIRDRMDWLLSDTYSDDLRFFFYSGHGAQIPGSSSEWETDNKDECLVPYNFDWTIENAFTDKEFLHYYSQLEYDVDFIAMLDCCNSGGMTRNGIFKAKGLTCPDDIRHREIKWDSKIQMWIPRELDLSKKEIFSTKTKDKTSYTGKNGSTNKLGRAIPLWIDSKEFENAKTKYNHKGPYIPILLEACREDESAWEYKHGVTSFGAFTYCMTTILRQLIKAKKKVTFNELITITTYRLEQLGYQQKPVVFGPASKIKGKFPF